MWKSLKKADLEITVGHRTLTHSDAVLSEQTFLPSNTMTDGEL